MTCRRILLVIVAVLIAVSTAMVVPATRVIILHSVAEALVVEDVPVTRADVIVVAIDAGSAGVMEAAELFRRRVASRVAVFVDAPGRVETELRRRGLPYEDRQRLYTRQLEALGIRQVVPTPRVSGTDEQGNALAIWCDQHGFRSVLVVTSWHHSRRVQRVLKRTMAGHSTEVTIRIAGYSDFGPGDWWQSRDGARTVITELQKLAFDVGRNPFL